MDWQTKVHFQTTISLTFKMHFKKSRKKESCCFLLQIKSFWALQVMIFLELAGIPKFCPKLALTYILIMLLFQPKGWASGHHRRPLLTFKNFSDQNWLTAKCVFDNGYVLFHWDRLSAELTLVILGLRWLRLHYTQETPFLLTSHTQRTNKWVPTVPTVPTCSSFWILVT